MKYLSFAFITLVLFSSCEYSQQTNQNPMCLIGSELFQINQKEGVDYLTYKNYNVQKIQNIDIVGENYHVFDKDDVLVYKALDQFNYFYGIYKNFMFIDEGTGNIRQLLVINLNTRETLFKVTYINDVSLENGQITFNYPFINEKPPYKPNCPEAAEKWGDMLGYIEKQIIDLNKNELIKTGEISCTYME